MNIPLATLIEASECLKLARATAPNGSYVRFLDASSALESALKTILAGQVIKVDGDHDKANEAHAAQMVATLNEKMEARNWSLA